MKTFSKIVLLAFSFVLVSSLALSLASTSRSVKADDKDWDHDRGTTRVVLECNSQTGYDGYHCATWTRVGEDGTDVAGFTTPPSDSVLVIKELEFADGSAEAVPGNLAYCTLLGPKSDPLLVAFHEAAPDGNVFGSAQSGVGVALTYAPRVGCIDTQGMGNPYLAHMNITLRGYLVAR
jgi:hypothetical protein